jgi:hypothetical protein
MVAALVVAAIAGVAPVCAQDGGVGELRMVDDTGQTAGQEPAPPGEKLFRLEAGVDRFIVAFDFDGASANDVQLRVMGPSGAVLFQETETYSEPGTYTMEFDNDGVPFPEQDYVVNSYIGPDFYLADSLQLVVGDAQLPDSGSEAVVEIDAGDAGQPDAHALVAEPFPTQPTQAESAEIPGGPSWQVLALAGLGVLVLLAIVVWAGWSALHRA